MSHRFLIFLVVLTGAIQRSGYAQKNYQLEKGFFESQVPQYEKWLERQNLKPYFEFAKNPLKIGKNYIVLYLILKVAGKDASVNAIDQLNRKYEEETGFPLNEAFFQKAAHLFDLPPEDLRIKVQSIPSKGAPPGISSLLRLKMDSETGIKTVSSFSALRSEVKDTVVIQNYDLPKSALSSADIAIKNLNADRKENEWSNYLRMKTEAYFKSKAQDAIDSSYPIAVNAFSIVVKNLKHEVIEPGVLKMLDPYEKLTLTIKIFLDDKGSLNIFTKIDGKYGPGLWRPRLKDYHEMDPQYQLNLEAYATKFSKDWIYTWITSTKN